MTALEAQIAVLNRRNAEIVRLYALLSVAMRPLVGLEVYTAAGAVRKAFYDRMPSIPATMPGVTVTLRTTRYSIGWEVSARLGGERLGIWYYSSAVCNIGEIKGNILSEIVSEPDPLWHRSDWTVAEVERGREAIRRAEDALSEAKRLLNGIDFQV